MWRPLLTTIALAACAGVSIAAQAVLARFAQGANGKKPILIGVSEGGAWSVLGATDPETKV